MNSIWDMESHVGISLRVSESITVDSGIAKTSTKIFSSDMGEFYQCVRMSISLPVAHVANMLCILQFRKTESGTLMKPIVLFGTGKIAEVILHFLRHCSDHEVVACTVDRKYASKSLWQGLPVVPFEELQQAYPSQTHDLFVALGYQDLNALREAKCQQARDFGYTLTSFIHPDAGVPSDFQHGDNCFIMNQANIHPCVQVGNNVFIWSGAMVGHHSIIEDNCWLTSGCNVSGVVTMGKNCFLAVNATVGHAITVAERCFLGANALVVKSTNPGEVFLAEHTKAFRLNSQQFVRMSGFGKI